MDRLFEHQLQKANESIRAALGFKDAVYLVDTESLPNIPRVRNVPKNPQSVLSPFSRHTLFLISIFSGTDEWGHCAKQPKAASPGAFVSRRKDADAADGLRRNHLTGSNAELDIVIVRANPKIEAAPREIQKLTESRLNLCSEYRLLI
ncbi:hypothetical protein GCM10007148_19630 [Parvularcula lutaonensis]|nr:hypothetical protein GCM10007148_19630 [Parvularcula lutaonensis]